MTPAPYPPDTPKRRAIPLSVRRRFWGQRCVICSSDYRICVDHKTPLAQGGSDEVENLQPLCQPCNLRKAGHRTDEEMRAWYAENKPEVDADRARRERNRYRNAFDWI